MIEQTDEEKRKVSFAKVSETLQEITGEEFATPEKVVEEEDLGGATYSHLVHTPSPLFKSLIHSRKGYLGELVEER